MSENKKLKQVNCVLCKKLIYNYQPAFNCLMIDKSHAVDICPACIDKFVKWRQGISATLFPTKIAKKWSGKS